MIVRTPASVSPLRHLDPRPLAEPTRAELRNRQNHLPPVSAYRWWARRSETVTGAILDAYELDHGGPLLIADPFAGGGVIALAALLRGHRVYAQDVNPWAARGLATMTSLPNPAALESAADALHATVARVLKRAYATTMSNGEPATIAHAIWVARTRCPSCRHLIHLFPTPLISLDRRVDCGGDHGFLACRRGHITHGPATKRTRCRVCASSITPGTRYIDGRVYECPTCGQSGALSERNGAFSWSPVLVERVGGGERELAVPTRRERAQAADANWSPRRSLPDIARGSETQRLIDLGMTTWHDLYPHRQRVVIERLLDAIPMCGGEDAIQQALRLIVIGSTEIAGRAARWDARYLKAYETIANHRFNSVTLAVEPNVWGADDAGRGSIVRRTRATGKASAWLDERMGGRLHVDGPLDATRRRSVVPKDCDLRIVVGSSTRLVLPDDSLDLVLTDPPYHDDVHYAELSDIFRAWAGIATGPIDGDAVVARGPAAETAVPYRALLTAVFREARRTLKRDGHLILSYANRQPIAWIALFEALQAAGFYAAGYEVVMSENGLDYSKAGRRSCTLDVILDLVQRSVPPERQHAPTSPCSTSEDRLCRTVGGVALRVGALEDGWDANFIEQLRREPFLS